MSKQNFYPSELRKSLNLIIVAVTMGMAFFTVINGPSLAAFTRKLGAGDLVYSIIMAMPVVGGIIQVFGSYIIETTGKRRFIFLMFGFIHRLVWIPIALVPIFIPLNQNVLRIWSITVLIAFASIASSMATVAFNSWMGALIPIEIRGRFFSRRTQIYTITAVITALAVGKFLDAVPGFTGYTIVFLIVAVLGAGDILCFIWIKSPPMEVPEEKVGFIQLFAEPFKNKNYMKFILFVSVFNFGVNFAGPFFNIYMLERLGMSIFIISVCTQVIPSISTILFIKVWGKLVDTFGSKPVLIVCCSTIVLLPLCWLFVNSKTVFIIMILNFFGGIMWPGYDMTSLNLVIWLAPQKNRSIYVANFTLITSVFGIALAFVCGGIFMELSKGSLEKLNIPFIGQPLNSFHFLFIISALIRLFAVIFLSKQFHEENSGTPSQVIRGFSNVFKVKLKLKA